MVKNGGAVQEKACTAIGERPWRLAAFENITLLQNVCGRLGGAEPAATIDAQAAAGGW